MIRFIFFPLLFGLPLLVRHSMAQNRGDCNVIDGGENINCTYRTDALAEAMFDAETTDAFCEGFARLRKNNRYKSHFYITFQEYSLPDVDGPFDMVVLQDHYEGHPEFKEYRPHFHVRAARSSQFKQVKETLLTPEWNGKAFADDNQNIPRARKHYFYKEPDKKTPEPWFVEEFCL